MSKPPPFFTIIRRLAAAALLISLSANLSPSRAKAVSGVSILTAASIFSQLLSQFTKSQLYGADPNALAVLQIHELLLGLKKNTDQLGNHLSLIHNRINLLPEKFEKNVELQFDLNAQDQFYAVIQTLTDEMSASKKSLPPDIPIFHRLQDLEVARNRLMQRSFLNAPAIIYGRIYEITYRKERKQSSKRISHVNQIYRRWLSAALDSAKPESLPSLLGRWRSRRVGYQSQLRTVIAHLMSVMSALRPYYIKTKPPRPRNCYVWLFCNNSGVGKRYDRWPSALVPISRYWLYPFLSHDASSYKYPGSCSRNKHDAYFMTIARCDWVVNHKVNGLVNQLNRDAKKSNIEYLPMVELYYEALLWEFMISELIRQVDATLSDKPFIPKKADFAKADYDVGCNFLKHEIASCWEKALMELDGWQQRNATAWAYTYRCVQHISTWNLKAGLFPFSTASSTSGPCKAFSDKLHQIFAARNLMYLQSSQGGKE